MRKLLVHVFFVLVIISVLSSQVLARNADIDERNGGSIIIQASQYISSCDALISAASIYATYQGTTGSQYRAIISFYAANSSGSDTRTMTTDIVTAVN